MDFLFGPQRESSMQLTGIHHLTAISANAKGNLAFYTGILGMRLVKKTVNQVDVSAYHLFYADGKASPGTDLTFFEWPAAREHRGTHSVARSGLRVNGEKALAVAKEMGLDVARLQKEMGGAEVRVAIEENAGLGDKLGLTGTPAFIIGEEIIPGAVGLDPLKLVVANTRQCGKATC